MSELKNCPFCGGEAELCYSEVDTFCRKCNVMQETELWNTRPIEDDLRKRIAELEALVNVSEGLYERIYEQAARIAELEALVDELKPYRDGYDAYEDFPEEGENVLANLGSWLFLAQRRGDKWYDSLGQQAEIRGGVERWWTLPESPVDQPTADSTDERKDDKLLEREVCEACGGDGTVLLTDGYEGQVMATVKCTYCNGTGRVNKERER